VFIQIEINYFQFTVEISLLTPTSIPRIVDAGIWRYTFQFLIFQAVYHLKASKELRLLVIKGAASDLFPGESSGYNSSASSINGETLTTRVSVESETSLCTSEIHVEEGPRGLETSNRIPVPAAAGEEATT